MFPSLFRPTGILSLGACLGVLMGTIVPQGGWSQPIVAQSQPELLDREIRFIVLGDTQFANKGVFESMVYEIEGLRPNFVVQVGDMIQGYTHNPEQVRKEWKEYFRQLAPLTAPFVPVAGNHDAVTPESELVWKETFGENRGHYSLDFGPVHLVVLNTWHGEEDDRIAEWQREWLKSDLQAWKERTEGFPEGTEGSVFVFTHSPLWRYKEDRPGYQDWLEVEKILADYPVKLVVGGHTHEHVNEVRNGINYLVLVSSGLITQNNPRNGFLHSYLHVSVLPNGDVRYGAIKAGSVLPLDTVTDEERGKLKDYYLRDEFIRVADWNEGTPLDQEIEVVLENPAPEARSFHLRWFTPKGSPVKTNIPEQWVEVEAKGTQVIKYRLQGETTPELPLAPRLEITAEAKEVPTGAIPKATLQRLSQSDSATNIPLVEKVEYKATYRLYEPPQATAQKRTVEIVIDGNLTDKGWESIPAIESFLHTNGTTPDVSTWVKLAWDAEYLYVAAHMGHPNPEKLLAKAEGEIPFTWNDDDFELFFDPKESRFDYWRLFQNSVGTRFNSLPRDVENKYYTSTYTSASSKGADYWTLEMQIPWKETGAEGTPEIGDTWGINIGRHYQEALVPSISWEGIGLYNIRQWGTLVFAE